MSVFAIFFLFVDSDSIVAYSILLPLGKEEEKAEDVTGLELDIFNMNSHIPLTWV